VQIPPEYLQFFRLHKQERWILRNDIIWAKPNAMPESVTDRLSTKHEHLFLLSKSSRYWFDLDAIREPHAEKSLYQQEVARRRPHAVGKAGTAVVPGTGPQSGMAAGGRELNAKGANPGDVWAIPTQPFAAAHFAVMPRALAERAIQAGCKPGGTVLDPFSGSGTTGLAAARHGRRYVGIDLNAEYLDLSLRTRLAQPGLDFGAVS
jgi:site-specific DNA-methyltransferase (cytosine-N4-specific)